jgi:hypothetical protein
VPLSYFGGSMKYYPVVIDFEFNGEKLSMNDGKSYVGSGVKAVEITSDRMPYAMLSVNIDVKPQKGCFWMKTWSENAAISEFLAIEGYVELTRNKIEVSAHCWAYEARLTPWGQCDYCEAHKPRKNLMDLHAECGTPILRVCKGQKDIDGEYMTGCSEEDKAKYMEQIKGESNE